MLPRSRSAALILQRVPILLMSSLTQEQRAFHLQKMRTRYHRLDLNKDGVISREDYEEMAKKLIDHTPSSQRSAEKDEWTRKLFSDIAASFGLKPGVKIPIEEAAKTASKALLAIAAEKQQANTDTSHTADPRCSNQFESKLFDALDLNNDGHISLQELQVYYHIIAPDLSEAEVTHCFNTIDSNKNGEISRDEFLAASLDFMFGVEESEISKIFFGHQP